MKQYIWPSLCVVLLLTFVIFFIFRQNTKSVFFYNDKVFAAFKGKEELEAKLKTEQVRNKAKLDSLDLLINAGQTGLKNFYDQTAQLADIREQQLVEQYTSDIWKFINARAEDYGKKHGYDFVFGAVGNGSLMYANEKNDITKEFVEYLNTEYTAGR